jgi:hypothetical protein
VYTYNTINNDYHRYVHNLELYSSKPSAAGCCIFYNKLPNNIKQIGSNNNQLKKELKDFLIKGSYYSTEDYFNEELCNITSHCNSFPGSKVIQNYCRTWNMSRNTKTYIHTTAVFTQANTVVTNEAIYTTFKGMSHFLDNKYSSTE